MNIIKIHKGDCGYPPTLLQYLSNDAPELIFAIGNLDILQHRKLALFCSVKCPGNIILQTYDLAQKLREEGVSVIGGFHSPMEKECLRILLRGSQPVILCPARSIERMRIRGEYRKPLVEGRLLILSPFKENQIRPTVAMALYRNQFVAALADHIFVTYAETNSKTEQFCQKILSWQKRLYTLESDFNKNLITLGATPVTLENVSVLRSR
ncbi:MAG: DNA-processing protein DprA [Pseudomonadota bacterium]